MKYIGSSFPSNFKSHTALTPSTVDQHFNTQQQQFGGAASSFVPLHFDNTSCSSFPPHPPPPHSSPSSSKLSFSFTPHCASVVEFRQTCKKPLLPPLLLLFLAPTWCLFALQMVLSLWGPPFFSSIFPSLLSSWCLSLFLLSFACFAVFLFNRYTSTCEGQKLSIY
eukprot:GHVS01052739.1.p1 GENE.GHVS01052739.1~~GHVS01052739.1.p1  ORF type:complete len:166 (-),score=27.55 GHVS01052739.1:950-1447(-)